MQIEIFDPVFNRNLGAERATVAAKSPRGHESLFSFGLSPTSRTSRSSSIRHVGRVSSLPKLPLTRTSKMKKLLVEENRDANMSPGQFGIGVSFMHARPARPRARTCWQISGSLITVRLFYVFIQRPIKKILCVH